MGAMTSRCQVKKDVLNKDVIHTFVFQKTVPSSSHANEAAIKKEMKTKLESVTEVARCEEQQVVKDAVSILRNKLSKVVLPSPVSLRLGKFWIELRYDEDTVLRMYVSIMDEPEKAVDMKSHPVFNDAVTEFFIETCLLYDEVIVVFQKTKVKGKAVPGDKTIVLSGADKLFPDHKRLMYKDEDKKSNELSNKESNDASKRDDKESNDASKRDDKESHDPSKRDVKKEKQVIDLNPFVSTLHTQLSNVWEGESICTMNGKTKWSNFQLRFEFHNGSACTGTVTGNGTSLYELAQFPFRVNGTFDLSVCPHRISFTKHHVGCPPLQYECVLNGLLSCSKGGAALSISGKCERGSVVLRPKPRDPPGDADLCRVCLDEAANCVLLPCSHFGTCIRCGTQLLRCPFCSADVEQTQMVFKM